jgi:hypothetical protein
VTETDTDSGSAFQVQGTWDDDAWDSLVGQSRNGTLLHTRRYLAHEGDRFRDASVTVAGPDGGLLAVLPAAWHPQQPGVVVSHPGLTYGGLVLGAKTTIADVPPMLAAVQSYYRGLEVSEFIYKQVPRLYHRQPSDDETFALVGVGATLFRCDLTVAVNLATAPRVSSTRKNGAKRAAKAGLTVIDRTPDEKSDVGRLPEFWPLLEDVLAGRHEARPTHTLAEMEWLAAQFPADIRCPLVLLDGAMVGGAVIYVAGPVWHTQYMATNEVGRDAHALDLLLMTLTDRARDAGASWLDFGTSMLDVGMLNTGLHHFKMTFGGQTHAHLHWSVPLS